MHYLVLLLILAITFGDQLTTSHILPKPVSFLPDLLSALALLYVIAVGARQRFQYVRSAYWLVFAVVTVVIVCGAFANNEGPGPLFAGLRYYFRAIPLFLLPAVYDFSQAQIRQQLRLLLFIGFVQLPFAVHQRMIVMDANRFSGDSVVGTLVQSSPMSMYLICAVCVLTGFTLRQRISKTIYFTLFFYLLAATTINETKGTLILLPFALLTSALVGAAPGKRVRIFIVTLALFAGFVAVFAPIYDYVQRKNPYFVSIEDFFTSKKVMTKYVDTHATVGAVKLAGRVDSIEVPLQQLSRDPVQLVFGLGIGNASHSSLGPQFIGAYYTLYEGFLVSSLSIFLLEIGLLGVTMVFLLFWLIFRDSLAVAQADRGFMGAIAVGWAGITVLMTIAMPYITSHIYASLSYLFWYMSGLVAAARMRLAYAGVPAAAASPLEIASATPGMAIGHISNASAQRLR
jgi:hypothetical protein